MLNIFLQVATSSWNGLNCTIVMNDIERINFQHLTSSSTSNDNFGMLILEFRMTHFLNPNAPTLSGYKSFVSVLGKTLDRRPI